VADNGWSVSWLFGDYCWRDQFNGGRHIPLSHGAPIQLYRRLYGVYNNRLCYNNLCYTVLYCPLFCLIFYPSWYLLRLLRTDRRLMALPCPLEWSAPWVKTVPPCWYEPRRPLSTASQWAYRGNPLVRLSRQEDQSGMKTSSRHTDISLLRQPAYYDHCSILRPTVYYTELGIKHITVLISFLH